ncbi:MAG: sodium/proton-translocating pyrophosphatase, partial [Acidobacteria bacterium]|nr:sodium/proton-translocating pyrophosphatase [Acidobacteriota bacterium]
MNLQHRIINGLRSRTLFALVASFAALLFHASAVFAQRRESSGGGEASLRLPDLSRVTFLGINGHTLLMLGLVVCVLGLVFGLAIFMQLKNLPVHRSMREISELIYETCKTYLVTQGKFILILEIFIGAIIILYYGFLEGYELLRVVIILLFSLVGIAGSYGVAWFGIRVNTFANSRTAFAGLAGK